MSDQEEKPVLTGLIALVAVAVVVGLLAGIAALIGTQVLGVGDSGGGSEEAGGGQSLVMPPPEETTAESGPLVTLAPTDDGDDKPSKSTTKKPNAKKTKKPKAEITLSAGASTVDSGSDLYLSGVYPEGEGAVLDIEIKVGDAAWTEFPVDVNVSGATFGTYVNTTKSGPVSWRVVDRSRKVTSNAVQTTYN